MTKNRPMSTPLFPVVAAAIVRADGRVLLQRRPRNKAMAGLWEFPGGKIESGETPERALARELQEELGIEIDAGLVRPACFASTPLGGRHLLLLLYLVSEWTGEPRALEASDLAWVGPEEMRALPMPPADEPLVELLAALIG